ncbi:MAG: exosortase C-terminal domain/associated protein EpsI, partial [Gammaproteobacteria bacterium]
IVHYTLVATLALFSVSTLYIQESEDILLTRSEFFEFPDRIGDWSGRKETLEPVVAQSLNADDYIMSNYDNGNGDIINLYIAYYADQQAGAAAHSPRGCIPGGGWQIKDLETVEIPELQMAGQPLSTNRLVIQKGDYSQLVYYWFQQRERIITNEYLVKWYMFWDSLTRNRTDGALVRLTTPIKPGEDHELADQRLIAFARHGQLLMDKYIPR